MSNRKSGAILEAVTGVVALSIAIFAPGGLGTLLICAAVWGTVRLVIWLARKGPK